MDLLFQSTCSEKKTHILWNTLFFFFKTKQNISDRIIAEVMPSKNRQELCFLFTHFTQRQHSNAKTFICSKMTAEENRVSNQLPEGSPGVCDAVVFECSRDLPASVTDPEIKFQSQSHEEPGRFPLLWISLLY